MKKIVLLALLSILTVTSFGFNIYLPIVANSGHNATTIPPSITPSIIPSITPSITPTRTPTSTPPPPGTYTYTADSAMDVNLYNRADAIWLNNGKHSAIQFGNYNYALIKFDLSSLPANAVVRHATLQLGLYEGGGSASIRAMAVENAGWIEGRGNFDPALFGEPCWAALASNGHNGVYRPWYGGKVDTGSILIGNLSATSKGIYNIELNVAAVQGWVTSSSSNAGLLVIPTVSNSNHVALREYATTDPSYIPRLVVTYEVAGNGASSMEIQPSHLDFPVVPRFGLLLAE